MSQNRKLPYVSKVATVLSTAAEDTFPVLRQVIAAQDTNADDGLQLEYSLDVMIAGLLKKLPSS